MAHDNQRVHEFTVDHKTSLVPLITDIRSHEQTFSFDNHIEEGEKQDGIEYNADHQKNSPVRSISIDAAVYKTSLLSDVGFQPNEEDLSIEYYHTENHEAPLEVKKNLKFRTWKSLFILSIAFLLQFTAFNGIGNLQSSVNIEGNIGVNSLSITYAFLIFSSIFLPHPMMAIFGLKWALVISQVPYVVYVAANYYPKAHFMYPAAALVGLSAAPLWTSKCSYLTEIGVVYANENSLDKNVVINRFFGIFFMFSQSAQIWGSLISYLVLTPQDQENLVWNELKNGSQLISKNYKNCGVNFNAHDQQNLKAIKQIDRTTIDFLCIIYVCICLCSMMLIIVFLNQRRSKCRDKIPVMLLKSVRLLVSTIKHLRDLNQILLIPLTLWSGLEQTFLFSQFTRAFISCTFNPKYVGLVLIAYGVCDSIGSLFFGQLVKLVGRWPCFAIATLINYSLIITMLMWHPSEDQISVLFVIAAFWGVADAVWQTQTNALYGVLFVDKSEAGFSNYRLWESAGFALFYFITPYTGVRTTLIVLLVFLTLGFLGYALTEYRYRKTTQIVTDDRNRPVTSVQS